MNDERLKMVALSLQQNTLIACLNRYPIGTIKDYILK